MWNRLAAVVFGTFYFNAVYGARDSVKSPQFYDACLSYFLEDRAQVNHDIYPEFSESEFILLQQQQRNLYRQVVVPDMIRNPSPYRYLPKGIKADFKAAFDELWYLAKDQNKYYELAQRFEKDVFLHSKNSKSGLEESFIDVLLAREKFYGFEKVVVVKSFRDNTAFLELLRQGHPIADEYYLGELHTMQGHRIQSILQAMHLEAVFGDPTLYRRVYSYMGDRRYLEDFIWEGTGLDVSKDPGQGDYPLDLYGYLYDTPFHNRTHRIEPSDYTNQEFFAGLRLFLPFLIGWK